MKKILITLLAVSGCAIVGPNYKKPEIAVSPKFAEAQVPTEAKDLPELIRWWTVFNDPVLNSLIERGLKSNLDLRLAEGRIKEVRAYYGIIESDILPKLNASGAYTHNKISENTSQGKRSAVSGGIDTNLYHAGFDASWEIDFFGGVARAREAAKADLDISFESRLIVQVTLLGEIARNYIEFRGIQQQLKITQDNLLLQQETLEISQARYQAGIRNYLDVTRAEAQVALTKSQIPLLEKSLKLDTNRLSVLLGQNPGALWEELSKGGNIPNLSHEVMVGIPSDLLQRRPDIRRAERDMAAASARIGLATLDLFPRFSLTGSFGLQGSSPADFGSLSSNFWSFGPGIRWPIFLGDRVKANIKVQDAKFEQALTRYEQSILIALEEVENAMLTCSKEQQRLTSLKEAVKANRQSVIIAKELYSKGLSDFLNVLEAERSLLISESQMVQSEANISSGVVALYKALGGGWEKEKN